MEWVVRELTTSIGEYPTEPPKERTEHPQGWVVGPITKDIDSLQRRLVGLNPSGLRIIEAVLDRVIEEGKNGSFADFAQQSTLLQDLDELHRGVDKAEDSLERTSGINPGSHANQAPNTQHGKAPRKRNTSAA
jgi:hypothetical protein